MVTVKTLNLQLKTGVNPWSITEVSWYICGGHDCWNFLSGVLAVKHDSYIKDRVQCYTVRFGHDCTGQSNTTAFEQIAKIRGIYMKSTVVTEILFTWRTCKTPQVNYLTWDYWLCFIDLKAVSFLMQSGRKIWKYSAKRSPLLRRLLCRNLSDNTTEKISLNWRPQ